MSNHHNWVRDVYERKRCVKCFLLWPEDTKEPNFKCLKISEDLPAALIENIGKIVKKPTKSIGVYKLPYKALLTKRRGGND